MIRRLSSNHWLQHCLTTRLCYNTPGIDCLATQPTISKQLQSFASLIHVKLCVKPNLFTIICWTRCAMSWLLISESSNTSANVTMTQLCTVCRDKNCNLLESVVVLEEMCKELAAIAYVKYHQATWPWQIHSPKLQGHNCLPAELCKSSLWLCSSNFLCLGFRTSWKHKGPHESALIDFILIQQYVKLMKYGPANSGNFYWICAVFVKCRFIGNKSNNK